MKDYCTIEGLKRIQGFDSNFELQKWCFDKIIYEKDIENYRFFTKTILQKSQKVPLNKIHSTWHIDYANKNWLQILGGLKRYSDYYTKNSFLEYINSKSEFPGLSFAKFGDYYSISEGNHRVCQAKFAQLEYLITDVTEFMMDEIVISLYKDFNRLQILSSNCNSYLNDSDQPDAMLWILTINNKEIYLRGLEQAYSFLEFYDNTKITWKNLLKKGISSTLGNKAKDKGISIKKAGDLLQLKNDILIHKLKLSEK